jgi:hypothetical protein
VCITSVLYDVEKGDCNVHPRTVHEGPAGEYNYNSTLSLTSALSLGWVVNATPWPFYLRERPDTHCIGGWVGLRAGLNGCGNPAPHPEKSYTKYREARNNSRYHGTDFSQLYLILFLSITIIFQSV